MHQTLTSRPGSPARPRLFELRLALIYAAAIAANGFFLPYFPLWLERARFDATAIAVILSAPMFLRVFTTLAISSYADRTNDRAGILIFCVAATVLLSLGYFLPPAYPVVLAVSLSLAVVWPVQTTIADSIALSGVRRFGADYSRMRIWGSIAYFAANFAGGLVLSRAGAGAVPALFSGTMALALVFALFTPRLGAPRARMMEASADTPLLRQPFFVLSVLAGGLIQASHAFLYSFSSIFWKSLGVGDTTIGVLWAFGVVAEVSVFALFSRLFARMSSVQILLASGAASVLRWTAFPFVWPLGLGLPGFLLVQSMHGISTGLMLVGVQKMIAEIVPEHQTGTAQGIAYFTTNFVLAVVTLGSGWLYARFGGGGFLAMAFVAGAGFLTALAARRFAQPQSAGSGG